MNYIKQQIKNSIKIREQMLSDTDFLQKIKKISKIIIECYENKNKVLLAGNGGSASDCQHLACELVSKINLDRRALNAISLTSNPAILTAISNDFDFETVFARQIEALGTKHDVFIALSTSGNSKNIINALEQAKAQSLITIGFTSETPCAMDNLCDVLIKIPSTHTPNIQEAHIMLGHIICEIVENSFIA